MGDQYVRERVRQLRRTVGRRVLCSNGDDVAPVDDVRVECVEQRVARALQAELGRGRVDDLRGAHERGHARGGRPPATGVAQHADAREGRVRRRDRRHEDLRGRAVPLRRSQAVTGGGGDAGRGQGQDGEPGRVTRAHSLKVFAKKRPVPPIGGLLTPP